MNSLEIYPRHHLVRLFGAPVKLTPMEFDILLLLARRPGQVFTARQIYEAVAVDSFDASWTGISSMIYPADIPGRDLQHDLQAPPQTGG